jgi:hypothetical protein
MLQEHPLCLKPSRAKLKIILKTKDEALSIENWISHHAEIVGLGNLLILDNLSTDPSVLDTYNRYASLIPIGAFNGFLNNPHSTNLFPELYHWLDTTTDFYIILDTDEWLVWVEGEEYFCDPRVVEKLTLQKSTSAMPGTWLYNQPGSKLQYCFGSRGGLVDGLRWGKPVLSTRMARPDVIIHNCQATALFDPPVTNLFVLHLSRLSVVQRLRTNINKLRSYSIILKEDGMDAVSRIDLSSIQEPGIARLIEQTLDMARIEEYSRPVEVATPHSIVFRDGKIVLGTSDQRKLLSDFVSESMTFLADVTPLT